VGAVGFPASSREALRLAKAAIRHRGPDDTGEWSCTKGHVDLGHSRLSIQDTSVAGHQPMISFDGRIVMVYNGELYNCEELRAELAAEGVTFKGHSDSEVLVNLYALRGPACFDRLNGIFAAAFWDRCAERLCLVRDPMGVKPLYFFERSGGLVFASEIKALIRSGWVEPGLEPSAVLHHLGYLWSPGADTVVRGVRKLLPGHALEFHAGRIARTWKYWDLPLALERPSDTPEREAERVATAVRTAVRRQLIADVPLGAFLSGGLDSSAIAAFAREAVGPHRRLQCFTIEITDSSTAAEGFANDLPYARAVAKHLDVDLHVVHAGPEMLQRLPEMVYLLDEPTPDPAALNTLLISELARSQEIKVLLSGAGGDDIFTGYRRHYALRQERWWANWPSPLRRGLAAAAARLPTASPLTRRIGKAFQYASEDDAHRLASYFLWLSPDQALQLLTADFRAGLDRETLYSPLLRTLDALPAGVPSLNRMLYLECKHFLADHNLNYADKMGMAAGVEIRVPLLDLDVVRLAASLPVDVKQRGRIGKWIFKKAMEPYLPHDVIYRPKTGFGVPLRKWLHGVLRPLVDDVLSAASLRSRGVFDPHAVAALVEADRTGRTDASYTIFGIVCMELWCRQYLDGNYAMDAALNRA